jgi:putative effector of murein hydrolase LrgA (UPF0299 family)
VILRGLLVLCGCQLAGEFVVRLLDVTVPGPVAGMLVLLIALVLRGARSAEAAADTLLPHLQLLFIPAGTGVISYLSVLTASWVPVAAGLVGAWFACLAVTAVVMLALLRGRFA